MNQEKATELTEEMVEDIELDESITQKVTIGKMAAMIVADLGAGRIMSDLTRSCLANETNPVKRIGIRIGGLALGGAVSLGINKVMDEIENYVIVGIKTFKAYKIFKTQLENENGTESEQSESATEE